ncbi:MAG: DUF6288 domain-containing protein [Chthoniobacter sp.]|nr:DUF6288 domain-containing protein [Chthoniobacter sp.]
MNLHLVFRLCLLTLVVTAQAAQPPAGPPPDATKDPKAAEGKSDWNLGPTGMRGWMFVRENYTDEARQIVVTKIDPGSPADGVMELGDVILGVAGKLFTGDARRVFGREIGEAEKEESKGVLKLLVWRKGGQKQIEVKLCVMGAYSDTAPYDCPKSKKILEEGCRIIAENVAKGKIEPKCKIDHLALLASGNPEYLAELKTYAHEIGKPTGPISIAHWTPGGPGGWSTGFTGVFLTEYYLATKDDFVLPAIKDIAHFIALGQSRIGTWASNMAWTDLNGGVVHGNLPGYGAINQAGLVCHMALILAKKCGVEDPEVDQAIERANQFVGSYVGKGTIPYGDHNPTLNCHDDNGKNCEAALVFDLQGMKEGSQFFTKLITASYEDREEGHTGNTFSHQWAGPGVARGGPKAAAAFLKEMRWYYDLARTWKGDFVYQGLGGGGGGYWDITTSYMLTYALPLRKIFLTGKDASSETWQSEKDVKEAIEAGRAIDYEKLDVPSLMKELGSWSLVVRTRSAEAIAKKKEDVTRSLIQLLEGNDAQARIGACQALRELKVRGAAAVPALTKLLDHDDLWLRVCAGEALAGIGEPARAALPAMLKACARKDPRDPRGFQRRGLAFSIFYPGGALGGKGLLGASIEGVDRTLLYPAIASVAETDDGRARGCLRSAYQFMTLEDVRAMGPVIVKSIAEKAPSGEMFASGVRLAGVKMLAKYRIKEGIPLCHVAMDWKNWGAGERITACFDALKAYGAHALPVLQAIEREWNADEATRNSLKPQIEQLKVLMAAAESDQNPPALISLKTEGKVE